MSADARTWGPGGDPSITTTTGEPVNWRIDRVGPGSPAVVVHVPHAGIDIPSDVRSQLALDDEALTAELDAMTDWHTDRLARDAAALAGVPVAVFTNRLSRLVVDPERFPDDREVMEVVGMGAVYRATSALAPLRTVDAARDADLLRRYFHPYAMAFADLVDEVLEASGRCVIVDLHSFPTQPLAYELDHTAHRPPVCIGTDEHHTPTWLGSAALDAFGGPERGVLTNTPFAGTYVPLRHYGLDDRVASVMVEIRRDQYLVEPNEPSDGGWSRTVDELSSLFRRVAVE